VAARQHDRVRWLSVVAVFMVLVTASASSGAARRSGAGSTPSATTTPERSAPSAPPAGPDEEMVSARAAAAAERLWQARVTEVTRSLAGYEQTSGLTFAVGLIERESGRTYVYGGERTFETASVVKIQIAAALLLQRQRAGRSPSPAERALMSNMIRNSDNAATSALYQRIGGATAVDRAGTQFGMTTTAAGRNSVWGQTTTTVGDQLRLLSALSGPGPLAPAAAAYLLDLMGHVRTDQTWGISAAAGSGQPVQLKNGWVARTSLGGRWVVNSVGLTMGAAGLTIVVLTRGARTMAAGVAAIETITITAVDGLGWR
jgi:beta-lactamase class A